MKLSVLSLPRSFTALALLASGLSLVHNVSAANSPSGPVVIPGGAVTTTYVISASGSYVLAGNRTLNDKTKHAIEINAPDVTLDLGGFTLAHGTLGGATTSALVHIPATENVEIRNGTLANAAHSGVRALGGKGLRVIDVRIVSPGYYGIEAQATAATIDRCHVTDCQQGVSVPGAGTLVTDCVFNACGVMGVYITNGSRILRSVFQGCARGIVMATNCTASDCTVTNASVAGIQVTGANTLRNVDVMGNTVALQSNASTVIAGSRITNNVFSINGPYIDGGGNVIQ